MSGQHNSGIARSIQSAAAAGVVIAAPFVGLSLAHRDPTAMLRWPPQPRVMHSPGFNLWIFAVALIVAAVILGTAVCCLLRARGGGQHPPAKSFPSWGWPGLALLVVAWALAWGLVPTPAVLRAHSFSALWLGYVVSVQALTRYRAGDCLLSRSPRRLLALFPASAAFWWVFEYLNQFVGNWHYVGTGLDGWAYFAAATLPFATVIPAVVSTRDLLATIPRLQQAFAEGPPAPFIASTTAAFLALALGTATLIALPLAPTWLFPFVWLAPTLILLAVQWLAGERRLLSAMARGDWRGVELAAAAGLVCGMLWEFWNWGSEAHWTYTIPYVDALHIFEMPLLGYMGYLPFGICCIAAATLAVNTPSTVGWAERQASNLGDDGYCGPG